jgi:hypothetical protein
MADLAAQSAVLALQARGLNYSQIARLIGRDSRLVSQIGRGERGAGYGKAFAPALQAAVSGAPVPAVARRQTATGALAGVRVGRGVTPLPGMNREVRTVRPQDMRRELARAARDGKQVQFTVEAANIADYDEAVPGQISLFQHGYSAATVQQILYREGWDGSLEGMGSILTGVRDTGIRVSGVTRITMTTGNPRR